MEELGGDPVTIEDCKKRIKKQHAAGKLEPDEEEEEVPAAGPVRVL